MVETKYIKILFVLLLLYVSISRYISHENWYGIEHVNLIFHEAGHAIFIFFNQFVYILGGTMFEIGIPLIVTIYFLRSRQIFAAGFGAWWTSTALQSVSIYAGDAQAQALPLLGGSSVIHDWDYLLRTMHILQFDQIVGGLFLVLSIITLCGACYLFYTDLLPSHRTHGQIS